MFKVFLFLFIILGCSYSKSESSRNNYAERKYTDVLDSIYRTARDKSLSLGTKSCKLKYSTSSREIGVLLSIHDDENTSIDAYNAVIDKCLEFSLIELKQSGNRLISFEHLGIAYSVDPNRIFSRNGLINSIKKYNPRYPDQVIRGFSEFASKLLNDIIPKSKDIYIIALHNNGQNNLSINSYIGGKEAKETFVNPSCDIDDFFYVTDKIDFDYFKNKKYNVVLQETNIPDDGSLSVYCQKNNLPYINIEAQDGHLEIQKKMIIETYNLIKSKQK
jgi:hypothetical protein